MSRPHSVLFGHQSVGTNILEGVLLLEEAGMRVAPLSQGEKTIPAGTLAHFSVGRNTDPESKLSDFVRAVDALAEPGVDIALLKFCYVDITADTDAPALAARYLSVLQDLRRRHPRTTFVPVTAPLTTVQRGPKAWLKWLVGRKPRGTADNVRREAFNAALRSAERGDGPLFDLAKVESTWPDGHVETVTWDGRTAPALVPAYTDDGGHLSRDGKTRAARELLSVLAAIP